jgi:hypothetical protein
MPFAQRLKRTVEELDGIATVRVDVVTHRSRRNARRHLGEAHRAQWFGRELQFAKRLPSHRFVERAPRMTLATPRIDIATLFAFALTMAGPEGL